MPFLRKTRSHDLEREPLLPHRNHDTTPQASLEEKLHTYRMLNAVSHGYMPSNKQLVAYLRHAIDKLFVVPPDISPAGKELVRELRDHLEELIAFLEDKNGGDQIQDFVWFVRKARLSIDTEDLGTRAQEIRPRANITTGMDYQHDLET